MYTKRERYTCALHSYCTTNLRAYERPQKKRPKSANVYRTFYIGDLPNAHVGVRLFYRVIVTSRFLDKNFLFLRSSYARANENSHGTSRRSPTHPTGGYTQYTPTRCVLVTRINYGSVTFSGFHF